MQNKVKNIEKFSKKIFFSIKDRDIKLIFKSLFNNNENKIKNDKRNSLLFGFSLYLSSYKPIKNKFKNNIKIEKISLILKLEYSVEIN